MTQQETRPEATTSAPPPQHPIPRGRGLVTTVGPGLVLAMTFLGTGDLVSSSVSGAQYGYALVWTLILSLFARIFIISALAKYTLMNRYGDTQILEGFKRIAPWLPGAMAVVVLVAGFVTQATFLKAAAIGLYNLTGGSWGGDWGVFICSVLIVGGTLYVITRRAPLTILEYVARFASLLMIGAYVYALIRIGHFDIGGFLQGLAFQIPEDDNTSGGAFAPIVIAAATIGTIAGNMPNLLYSGFMKDKGWTGPRYRRIQQLDLIAGMAPLLIINLLFWIVAAEHARDVGGLTISNEQDLAGILGAIIGPIGPYILWLVLFSAAATSFPPESRGFAQLAMNGIHLSFKKASHWLGRDEEDPWFKRVQIGLFTVLPLVASLPFAPNLVTLSVAGTALSTLLALPAIVIALLLLTSRRKHMLDYAVNKPWATIILGVLGVIAVGVGIQIAINLPTMVANAFGG
ncbi:Nramp family divalent metal transporter [Nocardioides bruguierae]|uniref:Nramp family divalent metal transporter n=1 Tax=Nocardioides bruguierae TaxID=2945102 RepID=UPI0020228731|nr:Nramp family divalent metal transporter [Nocardioides bruguierae]MCL8026104.1 Nramp family divalent metal transporter [Nocardioides bruguierae]